MKILKIFGLVVAVHAAVFMFIFAIPGCRSTGKQKAAAPADASSPVASTGDAVAGSPVVAGTDVSAPPQVLFSPTRPGTAAAAAIETPAPAAPQSYTVVKGDSLWSVAKKNGVTLKELTTANNLTPSSSLRLGQKLVIPGKTPAKAATSAAAAASGNETLSYTVKSGDTLALIARHAGTTKTAIKTLNKLKSDVVRAGQVLVLPAGGSSAPAPAASVEAAPAASGGSSMTHVVKTGDTLGSIARKYQVKVGDLATANNIADPTKIRVGQKLKIPGWQAPAAPKSAAPLPAVSAPAVDASPVAPASESPLFSSPLVSPAPDSSSAAPVIKIEDSAAPKIN
jgi:LysM repeat protein